jgi:hypothetical protein
MKPRAGGAKKSSPRIKKMKSLLIFLFAGAMVELFFSAQLGPDTLRLVKKY